ncbi:hypothetical protein NKR23_g6978 [Pleurostoma richardsiae]|uniref:Uncharacterized protein n=1 Tax=Pleurostoma richardsiae TaxID=41990 RepID=A0AA38RMI8_9PEZI|nr:hypothetical protein NKR23_g6978 [Pleurostoma richardsiae]
MADRHGPRGGNPALGHRARNAAAASAAPSAPPAALASAAVGVRRNLFQSQLTRRPTAGSTSSSGTAGGGGTGLGLGMDVGLGADPILVEDAGGIVVRDRNGEVALEDPPTPLVDDPDEVALDSRLENEKERQRLADAVKFHQINQHSVPAQPEELLEAVRASLRAKVAALAEDNWMFEREDDLRHQ